MASAAGGHLQCSLRFAKREHYCNGCSVYCHSSPMNTTNFNNAVVSLCDIHSSKLRCFVVPVASRCAGHPQQYASRFGGSATAVDPRGIEPLSSPCHGGILPVYYGPG